MTGKSQYNQIIQLIKTQQHRAAWKELAHLIHQDPKDEGAWLLLAAVADDAHKKENCLRKVLEINPSNPIALKAIANLHSQPEPGTQALVAIQPSHHPRMRPKVVQPVQNRRLIHKAIAEYTRRGWKMISKDNSSLVMKSPKLWNVPLLVFGAALLLFSPAGVLPILIAILAYLFQGSKIVHLTLNDLEKGGNPLKNLRRQTNPVLIIAGALALGGWMLFSNPSILPPQIFGSIAIVQGIMHSPTPEPTIMPTSTPTRLPTPFQPLQPTKTPQPTEAVLPTEIPSPTEIPTLAPEQWMDFPVIPEISTNARDIYQRGLEMGSDPHAFSVIGDCQSMPNKFLVTYDYSDYSLSDDLHYLDELIANFQGSFSRYSPSILDGGNAAAELSIWWANPSLCLSGETPLLCELRIHQPSIVFVNLGTHFSDRNADYLSEIVSTIIDHGALPILATKGDNLEGDHSVNLDIARVAADYDIPLWNFWATIQDLPEHGMDPYTQGGYMYLIPQALEIRRLSALQVLDAVWKAVR